MANGMKRYRGKYVATVTIDLDIDPGKYDYRSFDELREYITGGELDSDLLDAIVSEIDDNDAASVSLDRVSADFHEEEVNE